MAERLASPQRMAALYALATTSDMLLRADVIENIAEEMDLPANAAWVAWLQDAIRGILAAATTGQQWSLSGAQVATLERLLRQEIRRTLADEDYDIWVTEGRWLMKRASHG